MAENTKTKDITPEDQTKQEKEQLARAKTIFADLQQSLTPLFRERQIHTNMYNTYDKALSTKADWQTKFAHSFPFIAAETTASFLYEGVTGNLAKPMLEIEANSLDAKAQAERGALTKAVKAQMENSNIKKEFYKGAKHFYIYGDWFVQAYWDRQERTIEEQDQINMANIDGLSQPFLGEDNQLLSGLIEEFVKKGKLVIEKNQPDIRTIHPNMIWRDPKSPGDLESSRYFVLNEFVPYDVIKNQAGFGIYIEENVPMLKASRRPTMPSNFFDAEDYKFFYKEKEKGSKSQTKNAVDKENPVIHLQHIIYPQTGEWETIGNQAVYLGKQIRYKNTPCPFQHIKAFEEEGKVYGKSFYSSIYPAWRLINKQECLESDNLFMHMRGYTVVRRDAGEGVLESLQTLQPGSTIIANDLGAIMHNRPDLPQANIEVSKQNRIAQMQQTVGLNEVLQGATPSSNVRSAGQQAQLANFGAKILSQQIRLIGEGFKRIGKNWITLNYEFLDQENILPLTGEAGKNYVPITPGMFPATANVTVQLSAEFDSKMEIRMQQLMQILNPMLQVPGANIPKFIKDMIREQGILTDPDSYFVLPDDQITALLLQQFGAGNSPKQNPTTAGQAAPQQVPPNPEQQLAGQVQEGLPQ
jgi:hypothetical protein